MEPDYLGYFSFTTIGIIIIFCLLRYFNQKCRISHHHQSNGIDEFYTSPYFANSQSAVNHFLVNENGISSLVIARVNHPQQLMGYVLDAGLLSPAPQIPSLPTYEEAVKPSYAPPKYEESSSGSVTSIAQTLPDSNDSTARVGSENPPPAAHLTGFIHRQTQRRQSYSTGDVSFERVNLRDCLNRRYSLV